MSQENVEVVRRGYAAWNDDDLDSFVAFFDPDIEWHASGVFPGFRPVYRGVEGVCEFWATMKDAWEHMTIHAERTFEGRDNVVVAVRFEAKGRQSGVPVELHFAHLIRLRHGLVRQFAAYPSLDMALEAAGLSE